MLSSIRELGWAGTALYALARGLRWMSRGGIRLHAYHLVAQPVSSTPALPPRRGRAIAVREIGLDEALRLPVDRPRAVIEERFRQGARCLLASVNGEFVGFLWFATGPYEEDEVRCRFVPAPAGRASWDFDVFVEPSARLGLAFMRLWDEANLLLSRMGIAWSISRISVFNPGSLASHRRLGLVRLGSALFVAAGGMQFMLASIRPYVHIGLRPGSRPVLELAAEQPDLLPTRKVMHW